MTRNKRVMGLAAIFFAGMGVGIAHAAAVGDTCLNWGPCNTLASSCARDVQNGVLCCEVVGPAGGCVQGTCKLESNCPG